MNNDDRKSLDFKLDDLDDFEPRKNKPPTNTRKLTERGIDKVSNFPSREAPREGQLNMKGDSEILSRFKTLCKEDRRSYVAMLEILMDSFEAG